MDDLDPHDDDLTRAAPSDAAALQGTRRDSSSVIDDVGKQIGPFKLLQRIGEGGMGIVYLAEQQQPIRRRVALKIIKPGMDSAQIVARFEAERQALAMMDHQHIARVFDAGATDTGRPYFVMELVHGVPITRYCDENRLSPRERLELFLPVCHAIQHAHQKGIIHRDIKPSNVLVTLYDGRPAPKIIDFGIAKATEQRLTERTMFTQFGTAVGTVEYMSPEQAELSALGVDTRSDIYSLGVVLYELLTGTTPLERQRLRQLPYLELVRLVKDEEPPRPSTRLSTTERQIEIASRRRTDPAALARLLRGDLDWIVMKALEKDRTRRYDTASGLARELERYLHDEPVEARPPSLGYRFGKLARRHRAAFAAAALLALAIAIGSGMSVWQAIRATSAERAAREQRDRAVAAERRARDDRDTALTAQKAADEARIQAQAAERQAQADRDRAKEAEEHAQHDRDLAVRSEQAAEAAAKRAEREAATAKAVTDFFERDVLARANPTKESRRDLKLREVLDRAAQNIAGRFDEHPLIEASIRETIAKAYYSLGAYPEAASQFQAAEDLRRRASGDDDVMVFQDLHERALVYRDQGRPADAERLYLQALQGERRLLGNEHVATLTTMANLGVAWSDQGKFREAEQLYVDALDVARRVLEDQSPTLQELIHNLGSLYLEQSKYKEAEPLLIQGLDLHRRYLGEEHPDTITSMNNLGLVHQALGRLDDAESLLASALELRTRVQGNEHPLTITGMTSLALLYRARDRDAEAEPLLTKALELRRKIQGDEHPLTITAMNNLALLYRDRGRYSDAESLLQRALELRRRVQGPEHPLTITAMNNLALVYQDLGRYDDAAPLFTQALELRRRVAGAQHPLTLVALQNLALLYQYQKKYEQAQPLVEELLTIRRRSLDPADPLIGDALMRLGANHLRQRQFAAAEPLLRECLGIFHEKQPDDWRTFLVESELGETLSGLKKYTEAEPLLLSGYEGMRAREAKMPRAERGHIASAIERLAAFYESRGDREKADQWREQLNAAREASM